MGHKPRILAFGNPEKGIAHHRIYSPLQHLERNGEIEVRFVKKWQDKEAVDGFQWATHVIASRLLSVPLSEVANVGLACRASGKKLIIDVDDWWHLPVTHPQYALFAKQGGSRFAEESMKQATEVWTTSKALAKKVKRYNKNIKIVPNGLDMSQPQWQGHEKKYDSVRFGYIGAGFHGTDIEASGIDLSNYDGIVSDLEGEMYVEQMGAKDWFEWMPVTEYGNMYRQFNVSLIPLLVNDWTRCKSHLKLIEAGLTGTAAIVSPVGPYAQYANDGINCLTARNPKEWAAAIERLDKNPTLAEELAHFLNRDMQDFTMDEVNKTRINALR